MSAASRSEERSFTLRQVVRWWRNRLAERRAERQAEYEDDPDDMIASGYGW